MRFFTPAKRTKQRHPKDLPSLGVKPYDIYIDRFNNWNAQRAITDQRILNFIQTQRHLKDSTVRVIKAALKKAVKTAFQIKDTQGLMQLQILAQQIKTKQPDPFVTHTLSADRRAVILGRVNPKIRLIVQALYTTGCRISELLNVRYADCEQLGESVKVLVTGKRKRKRYVYLTLTLYNDIVSVFKGSEFVFEGRGNRPISRVYVWAQIKKADQNAWPQLYRHSRITDLLDSGKPIDAVSRFAGHSNIKITLSMYSHTTLSIEEMTG